MNGLRAGGAAMLALSLSCCAPRESTVEVTYACEDGSEVAVTYDLESESATLGSVTLAQEPSGSGALYRNGGYEIHGKGDEILLTTPGSAALACRKKG